MTVNLDSVLDEVTETVEFQPEQGAELVVHERHLAEFPQTEHCSHQQDDPQQEDIQFDAGLVSDRSQMVLSHLVTNVPISSPLSTFMRLPRVFMSNTYMGILFSLHMVKAVMSITLRLRW